MNTKANFFVGLAIACITAPGLIAMAAPSKPEQDLLSNIAKDGLLEVKLGQLAEKNATDKKVQDFAKHMVRDHSKANEGLKEAAEKDGVKLPAEISADQKKKENELAKLSGSAFDSKYMSEMVAGHMKACDAVRKESETGSGNAKAWAEKTLPVIEEHKKEADGINSKLLQ